jgi:hypothetical protein
MKEARGGKPPLPDPPLFLGSGGSLRLIPSGLGVAPGDLGKIDSHTRAEPLFVAALGVRFDA